MPKFDFASSLALAMLCARKRWSGAWARSATSEVGIHSITRTVTPAPMHARSSPSTVSSRVVARRSGRLPSIHGLVCQELADERSRSGLQRHPAM